MFMKELLCVLRFASFHIWIGCGLKPSQKHMELWIQTIETKYHFFFYKEILWIANSVWRCVFFVLKILLSHGGTDTWTALWLDVYFFFIDKCEWCFLQIFLYFRWSSQSATCFTFPETQGCLHWPRPVQTDLW